LAQDMVEELKKDYLILKFLKEQSINAHIV